MYACWLTLYQIAGDSCGDHSVWPVDKYSTHYQQDDIDGQVLSAIGPETEQLQKEYYCQAIAAILIIIHISINCTQQSQSAIIQSELEGLENRNSYIMYIHVQVWLLSTPIRMSQKLCGALVQFGCYQHRHVKA